MGRDCGPKGTPGQGRGATAVAWKAGSGGLRRHSSAQQYGRRSQSRPGQLPRVLADQRVRLVEPLPAVDLDLLLFQLLIHLEEVLYLA